MIAARIALQTKCLAQPLRQALHTAGRLGYEGVQIDLRRELPAVDLSDTALRQLRKMLDDLNLRVGSAAFPTRGYAIADELERRLKATKEAMRAASRLGARFIILTTGDLPDPDQRERSILLEALSSLSAEGNRVGVQIALQAANVNPADMKAMLEELPEGMLGVDLSPADLILAGQSPRAYAEQLGSSILHVFANDAVRGIGGHMGVDVELGRGTADFPELLGALEEHDYRGWITVERRSSSSPAEDADNAMQFLHSL